MTSKLKFAIIVVIISLGACCKVAPLENSWNECIDALPEEPAGLVAKEHLGLYEKYTVVSTRAGIAICIHNRMTGELVEIYLE